MTSLSAFVVRAPKFHAVASCRWCGGQFRLIHQTQWICENDECADKQIAEAITRKVAIPDKSPYLYLPLPLQVEIDKSDVKRLLVHGPAGISKSFGSRWHLYKLCRELPGYQALLLRVTLKQLEKNHLKYAEAECQAMGDAEYKGGNDKKVVFDNGSEISMGYCDSVNDISQHIGTEWDEIIPEEAVHFLPQALSEITSRDRGSSPGREAMYAAGRFEGRSRLLTNPGGRAMRFLEDHYITRQPNPKDYPHYEPEFYGNITGDVRDNPYLSETYAQSVLGGLDAERYEQLAAGRWDVFPGQFFHQFNPKTHVTRMEP